MLTTELHSKSFSRDLTHCLEHINAMIVKIMDDFNLLRNTSAESRHHPNLIRTSGGEEPLRAPAGSFYDLRRHSWRGQRGEMHTFQSLVV